MRNHRRQMRRIPHNKRERRRAEVWAFVWSVGICVALTWYALAVLIR